ncbi:uncharacterized protein LOC124777885 [Schistocerca piceifrons]|uniref:uncharacterized protein LOC124777885 n=1 Tax=Schistocerca piceifrons TaxID=274613 RepID=UPI001F5E46E2|nr:uncharacterized protein LOC124777885 [Schistocerca piceifrons]
MLVSELTMSDIYFYCILPPMYECSSLNILNAPEQEEIQSDKLKVPLRLMHLNIQYLINKLNVLQTFVNGHSPHVVVLTEHGLKSEEIIYIKLDGYFLGNSYCRQHHKGGGVAIFVREQLKVNKLNHLDLYNSEGLTEVTGIELHIRGCGKGTVKQKIIGIYRPPKSEVVCFIDIFSRIVGHCDQNEITILGDLNIEATSCNNHNSRLIDTLNSYNLMNAVNSDTRVTQSTSSRIAYIILSKEVKYSIRCWNVDVHFSDHKCQFVDYEHTSFQEMTQFVEHKRMLKEKNNNPFKSKLTSEEWQLVLQQKGSKYKWAKFYNIILQYLNFCCPVKEIKKVVTHKQNVKNTRLTLPAYVIKLGQNIEELSVLHKSTKLQIF